MRRALACFAVLLAGASSFAAEPAPLEASTTAYWSRTYDIQDCFIRVGVTIPVADPPAARKAWEEKLVALGARRLGIQTPRYLGRVLLQWPDATQSAWIMPAPALDGFLRDVRHVRGVTIKNGAAAPDYRGELQAKRKALLDESTANPELVASEIVRSLLEYELGFFADHLALDDMGRRDSALLLTIAPPGQSPPFDDFPRGRLGTPPMILFSGHETIVSLSSSTRRFPAGYWVRTPIYAPSLLQGNLDLEVADVWKSTPAIAAAALRAGFRRSDVQVFISPAVGQSSSSVVRTTLVFDGEDSRLQRARELVSRCGRMIRWDLLEGDRRVHAAAAAKAKLLADELHRLSPVLSRAPATRALLSAELARLTPPALRYAQEAGRARLEVTISPTGNPR